MHSQVKTAFQLSSLSAPPRGKQRGSHARREAAARLAAEEEERNGVVAEDAPEEAKIRYTIMHDQPYYHGRFVRRREYFPYVR